MSNQTSQQLFLARHGETEWSRSGQHTGRTDIGLTEEGRVAAKRIGAHLNGKQFGMVLTSPLARAFETCELAGYGSDAVTEPNLMEWDYGIYEGRTTLDIREEQPDWSVWKSAIVNGESLEQVAARANLVIERALKAAPANVVLFAHGHVLRILAAVWIGTPPLTGRYLALDTATVSVLGYERQTRVIRQWNFTPQQRT